MILVGESLVAISDTFIPCQVENIMDDEIFIVSEQEGIFCHFTF